MRGSDVQLLEFLDGSNQRYVIPIYQRKYDWKIENCNQLYAFLKKVIDGTEKRHFFGSVVSQVVPDGGRIEFHIIDGQQRVTTVLLLLQDEKVKSEDKNLASTIMKTYILAEGEKGDNRIKLRPVTGDRESLRKLMTGDSEKYDDSSIPTVNDPHFYELIQKQEVSVDQLLGALKSLQIISITLEQDDHAQLIFESLNSTWLTLSEGAKIRNYLLMSFDPDRQEEVYTAYWAKIERCCTHNNNDDNVSSFICDYLSIKTQVTPAITNVCQNFKKYAEQNHILFQSLLKEMLKYARIYEKLHTGQSKLENASLDDCMKRLNRLEVTVAEPSFMKILRLNQDGLLSADDVTQIFLITVNYLFSRNICEVPTNALNKIFLNLIREIIRYDGTMENYVQKFIYTLLSKKESGRFPDNEEFTLALANKEVYQMRGKYKIYLLERFENYGTLETKDVYSLLDNGTYSIEHIMPQHLTPAWIEALGPDAETIHSTWLHRLGNLTLTAYN